MAVIREADIGAAKKSFETWANSAKSYINSMKIDSMNNKKENNKKDLCCINTSEIGVSVNDEAMAVRYSLYVLEHIAPGCAVEVRVAPWGAVKILEGPHSDPHNLTPPDVIELDPDVWLRLSCAITKWDYEQQIGNISAVGERDDLSNLLPELTKALLNN